MEMIINCLDSGEVDLVFTYERSVDHRHTFHALFAAPPYALIATTDPLSQQTEVTPAQLATRPMVLLDLPFTRDYFTSLFDGMQGVPTVAHSTRSSEMVRALVSAGFGFSILNIRPLEYGEGVAEKHGLSRAAHPTCRHGTHIWHCDHCDCKTTQDSACLH